MTFTYKSVDSIPEFVDCIRLRYDTFVREMGMLPGWEPDEDDKVARHFLGLSGSEVVATGRYREISRGEFKIERMVTRKDLRREGLGRRILEFMLAEIDALNPSRVWLRSQIQVEGFYRACGFTSCSEPFELFGVKHIDMERRR